MTDTIRRYAVEATFLRKQSGLGHVKPRWRGTLPGILMVVLLSGCASQRGQQYQYVREDPAVTEAKAERYCRYAYSDARINPVRSKVPIRNGGSIPIQMMSSNEFPSKEEAAAILVWAEQRQKCFEHEAMLFDATAPGHIQAQRLEVSQLMAELYEGKITYGQYATQLTQNRARFFKQDAVMRAQAARDQAQAAQAARQNLYQQQLLDLERQRLEDEQEKSRNTHRYGKGARPQVNCTTTYIGNQAYTKCN